MISIITPVYNEEHTLIELHARIKTTLNKLNEQFEIIFVDNGSTDESLNIIKKICENNKNIKYISLTKNVGHQGGIWSGINNTNNTLVIIDADLQQPPEVIEQFIKKWKEGFNIIKTKKINDKDARWWKKFFSSVFYKLINRFTKLKLFDGQSDFCLIDTKVVREIKNFPEKKTFLRGILNFTGFESCFVEYSVDERKSGISKFSKNEYLGFALEGIFNYSRAPIIFLFWFGFIISILCFFYIIYLISIYFIFENLKIPPGWITTSILLMFFGSMNLVALSILGKYILLLIEDNKKRPEYFIKEKNF